RTSSLVYEESSRRARLTVVQESITRLIREGDLEIFVPRLVADGRLDIDTVRSLATTLLSCCRESMVPKAGDKEAVAKAAAKRTADKYF
nr:hypothetical protein [Pseudomonadota bacterium]